MDRLGLFILLAAGFALPGALIILVLSLGYYGVPVIIGAAAIGAVLAIPASHYLARYIKKRDPEWDSRRERPKTARPADRPEVI